jgi:3-hydroxyisobutyrate dehydrogenase-like beta-hydroxyacid dehydrogenase
MLMDPTVVVIAMGEMGAGIAKRLMSRGARVRTSLRGRGEDSARRTREASAQIFEDDGALLDGADFILSVVPPAAARSLADRLEPALHAATRKPVYVDCNAISVATVTEIAAILAPSGCGFADCGILGFPPKGDDRGPRIYLSGPAAQEVAALARYGLDMRVIGGEIGKASALKCCYAALGKGVSAIAVLMILGAQRAGVDETLRKELVVNQPELSALLSRQLPGLYSKAHRWVAEMEEIAAFLNGTPGGETTYRGIAELYDRLAEAARQRGRVGNEIDVIEDFRAAMNLR